MDVKLVEQSLMTKRIYAYFQSILCIDYEENRSNLQWRNQAHMTIIK